MAERIVEGWESIPETVQRNREQFSLSDDAAAAWEAAMREASGGEEVYEASKRLLATCAQWSTRVEQHALLSVLYPTGEMTVLGMLSSVAVEGDAPTRMELQQQLMDRFWDPRLDTVGATPVVVFSSEAWIADIINGIENEEEDEGEEAPRRDTRDAVPVVVFSSKKWTDGTTNGTIDDAEGEEEDAEEEVE